MVGQKTIGTVGLVVLSAVMIIVGYLLFLADSPIYLLLIAFGVILALVLATDYLRSG